MGFRSVLSLGSGLDFGPELGSESEWDFGPELGLVQSLVLGPKFWTPNKDNSRKYRWPESFVGPKQSMIRKKIMARKTYILVDQKIFALVLLYMG